MSRAPAKARSDTAAAGEASSSEPGSICIGCGLCCDGTLHRYTKVKQDDEAAVAKIGLEIVEIEGGKGFRQPCAHFSCGKCQVYALRPPVCRGYECALLRRVSRQELSIDEARAKIETAKELIAAVQRSGRDAATAKRRHELSDSLKSRLGAASGAERKDIGKTLLDIGALDHFLLRWFHKKRAAEKPTGEGKELGSPGGGESSKG